MASVSEGLGVDLPLTRHAQPPLNGKPLLCCISIGKLLRIFCRLYVWTALGVLKRTFLPTVSPQSPLRGSHTRFPSTVASSLIAIPAPNSQTVDRSQWTVQVDRSGPFQLE